MTKARHPGKTKAQRAALDAIGCGNYCPPMHPKMRDALLAEGLIVQGSDNAIGRDSLGTISIPQFYMPIPVHMQWCEAVAGDFDDDEI